MADRLSRWISANRRFLGVVGAGALLLLILHWWFVSGPRESARKKLSDYKSTVDRLKRLSQDEDPPTDARLRQRSALRDELAAEVRRLVARIGAPPAGPFIPRGDDPGGAVNYFFTQRSAVLAEVREAASARAVQVMGDSLGLPEQAPPEAQVGEWLWHLQGVRRAVLAAIDAGVDTVRGAQVGVDQARQKQEVSQSDKGAGTTLTARVRGTPFTVEVDGTAAACAAWLEALQREDGFLVLVGARVRRDEKSAGGVVAAALLMGVHYDPPSDAAPEQP